MKRVAIVGSCVSRDAFSMFPDEGFQVVYYCQQTCVPSIMSKAILAPADINDYPLSVFFRRNLLRDLNKTLFHELEKIDFDILILDLIEERYDLFRFCDTWISESSALEISPFHSFCLQNMILYPRLSLDKWIFDTVFTNFGRQISEICKDRLLVINKAFFASTFLRDERLQKFDEDYVLAHNRLLSHYYSKLLEGMPNAVIVDATEAAFRADPNHRWGLFPFHYEPAFYRNLVDELHSLVSGSLGRRVMTAEERWAADRREAATEAWLAARDLYLQKRYRDLIAMVEELAKKRFLTADECHYYGRCLLELNENLPEAERLLRIASENGCAEPVWVRIFLASAQSKLGNPDKAIGSLRGALELAGSEDANTIGHIFHLGVSVFDDVVAERLDNPGLRRKTRVSLANLLRDTWNRRP